MKATKIFAAIAFKLFVFLAIFLVLGWLLLGANRVFDAKKVENVSKTKNDLRILQRAVQAYSFDYNEFPRMTWCEPFKLQSDESFVLYQTLAPEGTGSIAKTLSHSHLLPEAPFHSRGNPPWLSGLYMYWNLNQYRGMLVAGRARDFQMPFPYAPRSEETLDAFERELGGYVLWSVGPAGWKPFLEGGVPMFMPYDPTNGTSSPGEIFVSEKQSQSGGWVDYEALEDSFDPKGKEE